MGPILTIQYTLLNFEKDVAYLIENPPRFFSFLFFFLWACKAPELASRYELL